MLSTDATTVIEGDFKGQLVLTCEHASRRLPSGWQWHPDDAWLVQTHWASDIGADDFTRGLASAVNAPAVLSNFSRLLVDTNRPLDSDTLFRRFADDRPVHLNASITEDDSERRLQDYYHPYHQAVSEMVGKSSAEIVFGVHSFTAEYEGRRRTLEVGVLFDHDEDLASSFVDHLRESDFNVAPNEPYSGKDGLAYSPVRHATEFARKALEIEVRQDLIVDAGFAERLISSIQTFFR